MLSTAILNLPSAGLRHDQPRTQGSSVEAALKGHRQVLFGGAWQQTAIYDRLALPTGARIDGPAILVQPDTTVLVEPGQRAEQDAFGNTRLSRLDRA